jgi:hypothetical protein
MEGNSMEKQKKKFKLNVVDLAIIIIIIGGIAFGGYRYLSTLGTVEPPRRHKFVMVLDQVEVFNDTFENGKINIGDRVLERTVNAYLGRVTKIESEPSWSFTTTAEGEIRMVPRPISSRLIVTIEGEGVFPHPQSGGLLVNGMQFLANRQYEIIIADSIFWLRIVELERLESN